MTEEIKVKDSDINHDPKMFWGRWHYDRIKRNLKAYESIQVIKGSEHHIERSINYLGDKIQDVVFSAHKLNECGSKCRGKF